MTRAGVLCRNSDRHGRAFAPGFRLGAPPHSRGFRSARAGGPGFRSRNPDPDFRDSGPKKSGFRAQKSGFRAHKVESSEARDPNSGFARPGLPEVPARRGRMCKAGRKSKPVTEAAISSKDRALLAAWLQAKVKKRSEPLKQPQSRMNAGEVDVLDFKQLCVSRCSLAPATGPPSHPSAPRRTSFTQRRLASALGRDRSTPRGCSPSSRSRDSSSRRTSGRTPTLQ